MSEVKLKRDPRTQRLILPKGTKIKINKTKINSLYKERIVTSQMYKLAGTIQEIDEYHPASGGNPGYILKGDTHFWDEGMFTIVSIPDASPDVIVHVGKYDENYIALVNGHFDEKIYSSLDKINELYKNCTIKLLF